MSSSMLPQINSSPMIVSLRSFTRDVAVRKKALNQKKAVIVENRKDNDFFVLLPPSLYDKLYEVYEEMKDSEILEKSMKKKTIWHNWDDVKDTF